LSYLTAAEYHVITGRPHSEATDSRIKRASMLLDARIGNYIPDETTGMKLDMDSLPVFQSDAVKEWVAQMVAFLYENSDHAPSTASVTLGRFSVTEHGQQGKPIPEALIFADTLAVSSGLVRRGVRLR
jgi:hypothetical protein